MVNHDLILDTKITLLDKDLNVKSSYVVPKQIELPKYYIDFLLKDADGELIKKETIPFRSFTKNFMSQLEGGLMANTAFSYDITASDNSYWSVASNVIDCFRVAASAADGTNGILVGTASTAVTYKDYKLTGTCVQGTGVNQFNYSLQSVTGFQISGSNRRLAIRRTMTNQNAASIVVTECGLFSWFANMSKHALVARDVLQYDGSAINVTVAQNQILEVVYNIVVDTAQGFLDNFIYVLQAHASYTSTAINGLGGYQILYSPGVNYNAPFINMYSPYGTYPQGICVGSGTTAVTSSDYNLSQVIAHGTGSNQLMYGNTNCNMYTASLANQSVSFLITRRFNNSSGAQVSVKEVGACIAGSLTQTANTNIMILKQNIGTVNLQDGDSLDVTYVFSISASVV